MAEGEAMDGFDETFDWVVVGSGAGSAVSALVMRQAGKSVLILEKTPLVGGTTAKSGGVMWIPNNRFMREAGETDSTEAAIRYLDAVCEDLPGSSHEKRLAYVVEAPKMIDFLVEQGVELERGSAFWPDYYDEVPGGVKTSRTVVAKPFDKKQLGPWEKKLRAGFLDMNVRLDDALQLPFAAKSWKIKLLFAKVAFKIVAGKLLGRHYTTAGAALQGRMLKAALDAGVTIRTECPVEQLIVEDGTVVGVAVRHEGMPKRIGAHLGVLVNAGGFAKNQALRDRHQPGTQAKWSQVAEGDTGDMHVEMERIGGTLGQMDQMVGYQTTLTPGWETEYVTPPAQTITCKPSAILVDQSGVRYMNEGGSYELYCQTMLERNRAVPAVPSWAIFDSRYASDYTVANLKVSRKAKEWEKAGYLKQADTIEGLAEAISVPPAVLKATVERWNGFVAKGQDEDFQRGARAYDQWLGDPFNTPNAALGPIDRAPFYAIPVVPGDVSTYGGVVTDALGRVVRADGTPLPGLYATGVSTASVMGGVYPGAGSSIGPAMTFGYVAAKHAAGLGNQL
ncbi:FAD-dependent oxidoreductase [Sphingomonas tabacisoli]|uniref:FAD-dependent oxidoreductase n=1 Tax=Sphingomonas tabacisoli TaxID=2249466 RepID=A0ABW4I5J8_9SPHN